MALAGCRAVPFRSSDTKQSQALILHREGIAAYERQEYELAEKKFAEAVETDKNDLNSQRYYAETLWERGKKEESLRHLSTLSQQEGSSEEIAAVNRSIAEKLLILGQPVTALRYAEKVIQLSPKRCEGWALRGNVYWQLGKTAEALADYHKAIHFAPENRDILWQLAILENQAGLYDRSLATWQYLGRLYPVNREPAEVLCGKGLACRKLRRYAEAAQWYESALRMKPEQVEIYSLLTEVYLESSNYESARRVAVQGGTLFPANTQLQELGRRVEQLRMASASSEISTEIH